MDNDKLENLAKGFKQECFAAFLKMHPMKHPDIYCLAYGFIRGYYVFSLEESMEIAQYIDLKLSKI